MPLPEPKPNENQDEFIERCMGDETMKDEFPDDKQRLAVCFSQWKQKEVNMTDKRGAIPRHKTTTSDKPWDGPANEARLKTDQDYEYYRRAYAWRDPDRDESNKTSYKFIHHEVSADGNPGAANIRACQTAIAVLNGARGGADIPDNDRPGVWSHVAAHLRDADVEPAPLRSIRGIESRAFPVELRVEGETKPKIRGMAAVFNRLSEDLGGYREMILPGAFKAALSNSDIRALWNHDPNIVLGRTKAGTLEVSEDENGLQVVIDPPSWAAPYLETIMRGDVSEMSFAFTVARNGEQWDEDGQVRKITKFDRIYDISPVTYPAYPQTTVKVRMDETDKDEIIESIGRYLKPPLDIQGTEDKKPGCIDSLEIKRKRLELEQT